MQGQKQKGKLHKKRVTLTLLMEYQNTAAIKEVLAPELLLKEPHQQDPIGTLF